MDTPQDTSQPDNKNTISKIYHSPQLIVYGNVLSLTNATGTGGTADGGKGKGSNKTLP